MDDRFFVALAAPVAALVLGLGASSSAHGEAAEKADQNWAPAFLADGQPDIGGIWNNVGAAHIPLQLPAELLGKDLSLEERQALVKERSDRRKAARWTGFVSGRPRTSRRSCSGRDTGCPSWSCA